MSILTNGFHPSFDALSTTADQSDLDAARTRTGRHVARCATCAAVVAEIREMGAAARAIELPGAPAGLWARIGRQAANEPAPATPHPTPSPEREEVWAPAPSLRPTVHVPSPLRRRALRVGVGILAAAALVIAVLVAAPSRSPLFATAASRITFTPFRPAPGARVTVRYVPAPKMAKYDRLVLVGSYLGPATEPKPDYYFGGIYDSLATLHRASDGAMVGEFTVPADFRAVSLVVEDPEGMTYDGDGLTSWILVGGDARGRPVLESLLGAAGYDGFYGTPGRARILDTLQRYFPGHPGGFAMARRYYGHGVFSDLLEFFKGAERKYAEFDAKLEKLPRVDAGRTVAMITFANNIEEPGEVAKWTERLIREHPDDPRAPVLYAGMLHEMENRGAPADSIRRLVARLDSLGGRTPLTGRDYGVGQDLIERYGDAAMQRRWILRAARSGQRSLYMYRVNVADRWLADPEIREATVASLNGFTARDCGRPTGHYARRLSYFSWKANCVQGRMFAYSQLSHIALLQHEVGRARAFADSSIALNASTGGCFGGPLHRTLANAMLAAGDTAGAARAFAQAFWFNDGKHETAVERDSIRRLVATAIDSARFVGLVAEAERRAVACQQKANAERKAAQAKE
jgi:hypothetical protein